MGISSFYTCVQKITIIWCTVSEVQSETDIMIPPLMIPKIHMFKKWKKKKTLQDIILLHMCHKWRSYDIWFLKDKAWQNIFCHFGPFLPFRTSDNPKLQKSNFEKLKKNTWRYYHFTHVHHKWQTFNLWLSGYGVCCHFGPFLALLCPNNPKKQNMEKFKKT